MKFIQTSLDGVYLIEPDCFGDYRGWFMESYSQKTFKEHGLDPVFIQDNHSYSREKHTLRGLHFQNEDTAQAKLVRCIRGMVLDVAVNLIRSSGQYRQWFSTVLSAENKGQLYIPKGFAHGYLTLCEDCEIQYKVDYPYAPEAERAIRYDDPEIGVDWGENISPILSGKDATAPFLRDSDISYEW